MDFVVIHSTYASQSLVQRKKAGGVFRLTDRPVKKNARLSTSVCWCYLGFCTWTQATLIVSMKHQHVCDVHYGWEEPVVSSGRAIYVFHQ